MPTRRTFDLIVLVVIGIHLGSGVVKGWASRKAAEADPGSLTEGVAQAALVAL